MNFDSARAYADVKALSFPRRSGGPGAARAATWILERFREAGLHPVVEPFTFSMRWGRWGLPAFLLLLASLTLTASFLYTKSPVAALVVLALGAVLALPATRWTHAAERLLEWGPPVSACNLVAALPVPARTDRHVLVMAHTDSKSQPLPLALRLAVALLALAGFAALVGDAVVAVALRTAFLSVGLFQGMAVATASCLGLLAFNPSRDESPGALDNAAGVAVLLELARVLPQVPLQRTRVTLVATGAEEEGLAGSVSFFRRHQAEVDSGTVVLNLDSVGGAGPVVVLNAFGLPAMQTGRWLVRWAEAIAAERSIPLRTRRLPPGVGTDHFPAALRGLPAITLTSGARALRVLHTPADTPDAVTQEGLAHTGCLVLALIQRLDAGHGDTRTDGKRFFQTARPRNSTLCHRNLVALTNARRQSMMNAIMKVSKVAQWYCRKNFWRPADLLLSRVSHMVRNSARLVGRNL